jgi:DNA-binding beta-propeller fold protein YncE
MTARIQAFDLDGHYLGPTWTTPDYRNGNLLVADSHYHTVRTYDAAGNELRFFGGVAGTEPGQLSYVSDAIQDTDGFYYVTEFGEVSRVSKFDADGKFVRCWGTEGESAGEFRRPRALTLGPDGLVYVADACNHRVQAFTRDGELRRCWGEPGPAPGKLQYPYDLAFGPDGNLYVAEYGNSRVQKFTPDGKSLGTWGGPGRAPGRLANPWALAVDRHGRVFVIDSDNHRVQRISW